VGSFIIVLITRYYCADQIKENIVGGACGTMGEGRNVYRVLVGKPEGKRPLERPRRRWEDGIKMDLREIGLGGCGVDSTGSG
jgi:hypothetical protein